MAWNQGLTVLRDLLAGLYPTEPAARQVVEDAGLPTGRIQFSTAASTNWQNILREADRRNQVPALVAVARRDYPERAAELARAEGDYLAAGGALAMPAPRTEEGERVGLVEITTSGGVNIRVWLTNTLRDPVSRRVGVVVAVLVFVVAIGIWFWPDIRQLLFRHTPAPTPVSTTLPILTLNLKLEDQIVEGKHTLPRDVGFIRVEVEVLSDDTPVPSDTFEYRWSFNPPDAKNQDKDWSKDNTIYYYVPEKLQDQTLTVEVRGSGRQWSTSIEFAIEEE